MNAVATTFAPSGTAAAPLSYRLVAFAFIVLCLFPWISFGLLDLDTQPWFICAAIGLCTLSIFVRADAMVVAGALSLVCAAVFSGVARAEGIGFLFIRGLLSYLAFALVLLGYYYYRNRFGFPLRIFVIANIVWLIAGLTQLAFGPLALAALVEVRTTFGRGVTGLAPEPTFYGMVLLFFTWIVLIESNYRLHGGRWLLLAVNLLFVLLVAKSAMAFAFVFALVSGYMLFGVARLDRFAYVVALLLAMVAAIITLGEYFPQWRLARLVNAVWQDPTLIVRVDASINQRMSHLVFAFYGFVANRGLPGGFDTFGEMSAEARANYGGLFWFGENDDKVMSGVGAVVYELGLLSIVFFLLVGYCTLRRERIRVGLFHFFGFLGTFAAALPVAFPLAPILLVTMFFWSRNREAASDTETQHVRAGGPANTMT